MAGSKILVIDGDLASRNYLAAALNKEGHNIFQAGSGKEGLIIAWRDHPDLIIADPVLADLEGEELARRLRSDERTARVPLIALSSDARQGRLRTCMEAGFNEYLIKTAHALPSLVETVNRFMAGEAISVKEGGLMITFLSAKGGTGTSSMCANIAMNIAEHQPESRVAVVDMVLPIGSIAGIVGYDGEQDLTTLAEMPSSELTPGYLRDHLTQMTTWRFHLIAGSPDPEHGNEIQIGRIGDIISTLKLVYDFVLIDLGRSLSRISLPLIEHADLIAMIVGTDLSTVRLTKTVWDYLQVKGVRAPSLFIILNRAVGLEGLTKPEAEKIIGLPINTAMPHLGGNFTLANNQHQPYTVKFPADTASIVFRETAQQMVELARRLRSG